VFAVLGVSILVDLVRSRQLSRVAETEGSDAWPRPAFRQ